jgi:hypothetical protein
VGAGGIPGEEDYHVEVELKGSGFRGAKVQGFSSTLGTYILRLCDKEDVAYRSLIPVEKRISNAEYRMSKEGILSIYISLKDRASDSTLRHSATGYSAVF